METNLAVSKIRHCIPTSKLFYFHTLSERFEDTVRILLDTFHNQHLLTDRVRLVQQIRDVLWFTLLEADKSFTICGCHQSERAQTITVILFFSPIDFLHWADNTWGVIKFLLHITVSQYCKIHVLNRKMHFVLVDILIQTLRSTVATYKYQTLSNGK